MQLYTLQRELLNASDDGFQITRFAKKDDIDSYESLIWTERYYGNGDVTLVCPPTMEFINKISKGSYLGLDESDEMMMVETVEVIGGKLNITGISVLPWMNNRFVRNSKAHKVRAWQIDNMHPGEILWLLLSTITRYADTAELHESNTDIKSNYLDMLIIPELGLHSVDKSGDPVSVSVDFQNLYDAMYKIATTYEIGMQIHLQQDINAGSVLFDGVSFDALGFRSYTGLNRTHSQVDGSSRNSIVTFSRELESLANPRELHSLANYKTIAFAFAPNLDTDLGLDDGDHNSGIAWVTGKGAGDPNSKGLDCRAMQIFAENLSGFPDSLSSIDIQHAMNLLNKYAKSELKKNALIDIIDGEVVSTNMYRYKRDYYLGDLVEIAGENGLVSEGRVMEYIRASDVNGVRGYPTVTLVDPKSVVTSRSDLGPPPNHPYDKVGDAYHITENTGKIKGSNVDCATDGSSDSGNTDWLVNKASPETHEDVRNWRTTWYKWRVTESDWTDSPRLKIHLTDYDSHMVLFVCTPDNGVIPDSGGVPTSGHRTSYKSLGWDVTDKTQSPPYSPLLVTVRGTWWDDDTYEKWIYIGIGSPPLNVLHQSQDRGGKFTLHWDFSS